MTDWIELKRLAEAGDCISCANMDPDQVLALIAENEHLKKMRALDQELNLERELIAERDQFRVEIEALQSDLEMARQAPLYSARMDAQRYRWLRDTHIGDDPESINLEPANKPGLNAAIDAAMSKEV